MGDEHPLKLVCLKMGFIQKRHFQWQNNDIDQLMEWGIGYRYRISLPTHQDIQDRMVADAYPI